MEELIADVGGLIFLGVIMWLAVCWIIEVILPELLFWALLTVMVVEVMGFLSERISALWFDWVAFLLLITYFVWLYYELIIKHGLKRMKYRKLFKYYLRMYHGDRMQLSKKIEEWYKEELRHCCPIDRFDIAKSMFPRELLVWYGAHRCLKYKNRNDKKSLRDFLEELKDSSREREDSIIEDGIWAVLNDLKYKGEL